MYNLKDMAVDYSTLAVGQEVSNRSFTLDADTVRKYVDAVGDATARTGKTAIPKVPPMAVAALGLRGALDELGIPRGALHAGQDAAFAGPVEVGARLTCRATVSRNSVRRRSRFVGIALSVEDETGREVMTGTTTLIMPDEAA